MGGHGACVWPTGEGGRRAGGALLDCLSVYSLYFLFFIYLFVYFFYVLCFNLAWESGRIKEKARKPESRRWLGRSKQGIDGVHKIIP